MSGREPTRTCVVCRERACQSSMLRFAPSGAAAVPDASRRKPGRGAYVHPSEQCLFAADVVQRLRRALKLGGGRAGKSAGSKDLEAHVERLREEVRKDRNAAKLLQSVLENYRPGGGSARGRKSGIRL